MQSSDFQFKNPRLINLEFEVKKDFVATSDEPIDIRLSFNVDINKSSEKPEAIVELTVIAGTEDNSNPFYIKATEGAKFKWNEKVDNHVDKLLEQNAPAVLLGYLRPIISMITGVSPFSAYNIPLIDFTQR